MDNEVKVRRYYGAIKALLWASLVCQLVGYMTPGWLHLDFSKDTDDKNGVIVNGELKKIIMLSLWYVYACDENAPCDVFSLSDIDKSMRYKGGMLFWKY